MMKNEVLDAVLNELKYHGVMVTVAHGSKHIQVNWLNRLSQPRFMTVSRRSSGERHAIRNARMGVRQILRDDCMLTEREALPAPPPRQLSKVEQLEHDLQVLNSRIARVERLLKEHAL